MTVRVVVLIAGILVFGHAVSGHGEETRLYFVKGNSAVSTIVIPSDADRWTRKASEWVQHYVREATGAILNVEKERDSGRVRGTVISVGHTRLAEKAGIRTDDLRWDGCKLVVKGDILYLIGRDQ